MATLGPKVREDLPIVCSSACAQWILKIDLLTSSPTLLRSLYDPHILLALVGLEPIPEYALQYDLQPSEALQLGFFALLVFPINFVFPISK